MKSLRMLPLLLVCAALAACGGDSGDDDAESGVYDDGATPGETSAQETSPPTDPPASGDDPRALARQVVTAMEACYAESQTYTGCDTAEALGDPSITLTDPAAEVPQPGEAQIPEAGTDEYTVKTAAEDGTLFTIVGGGGASLRQCAPPGQSGCGENGSW